MCLFGRLSRGHLIAVHISRNIARKIVISYTHLLAGSRKSSQGTEIFIIVQVMSQSQKVGGVRIFVKRTKFRNANYFDF